MMPRVRVVSEECKIGNVSAMLYKILRDKIVDSEVAWEAKEVLLRAISEKEAEYMGYSEGPSSRGEHRENLKKLVEYAGELREWAHWAAKLYALLRTVSAVRRVAGVSPEFRRILQRVTIVVYTDVCPTGMHDSVAYTNGRSIHVRPLRAVIFDLDDILDLIIVHELMHIKLDHLHRARRLAAEGVSTKSIHIAADYSVFREMVALLGPRVADLMRARGLVSDKFIDFLLSLGGDELEYYRLAPFETLARRLEKIRRQHRVKSENVYGALIVDDIGIGERKPSVRKEAVDFLEKLGFRKGDPLSQLKRSAGIGEGGERELSDAPRCDYEKIAAAMRRWLERILAGRSEKARILAGGVDLYRSVSRPSRRTGEPPILIYQPAESKSRRVYILIDTSYSISPRELMWVLLVIHNTVKRLGYKRVRVILWADKPYYSGHIPTEEMLATIMRNVRGGGTLLVPALREVERAERRYGHKLNDVAIIIVSDLLVYDAKAAWRKIETLLKKGVKIALLALAPMSTATLLATAMSKEVPGSVISLPGLYSMYCSREENERNDNEY